MRQDGRMYVCDRCGKRVFVMIDDERKKYDITPVSAWTVTHEYRGNLDLCESCAAAYRKMLEDFYAIMPE